jgi:hypothetical protein
MMGDYQILTQMYLIIRAYSKTWDVITFLNCSYNYYILFQELFLDKWRGINNYWWTQILQKSISFPPQKWCVWPFHLWHSGLGFAHHNYRTQLLDWLKTEQECYISIILDWGGNISVRVGWDFKVGGVRLESGWGKISRGGGGKYEVNIN